MGFLLGSMLIPEPADRHTLQQCLIHPFVAGPGGKPTGGNWEKLSEIMPDIVFKDVRGRAQDHGTEYLYQGTLWKLNAHADPMDISQWFARDMWVTLNGNLCYFSQKEGKRLILLDACRLHRSIISDFAGAVRDYAFQVAIPAECEGEPDDLHFFACNSKEEHAAWKSHLQREVDGNTSEVIKAGLLTVHELHRFKLSVRNHRLQLPVDAARDQFEPLWQSFLWKLKFEGDPHNEAHWFHRKVWLSKNGSLVYWSDRENRELIYLTSAEIARVSVMKVHQADACKPWAFKLVLPPNGDFDFAPCIFSCESLDQREDWIRAFRKFTVFSHDIAEESYHQRLSMREKASKRQGAFEEKAFHD